MVPVIEVGTIRKPVCDFLLVINSNWQPKWPKWNWNVDMYHSQWQFSNRQTRHLPRVAKFLGTTNLRKIWEHSELAFFASGEHFGQLIRTKIVATRHAFWAINMPKMLLQHGWMLPSIFFKLVALCHISTQSSTVSPSYSWFNHFHGPF